MPFDLSVEEAARRIRAKDAAVRAFVSLRLEEAMEEAKRVSPDAPLARLPYSLKDMWNTDSLPTSSGSARFRDRVVPESAPIHRALTRLGAVLVGKTNLPDLGLGVESQSYVRGTTNNPLDPTRTAGGSSGGAAAAVSAGMVCFDWGSDFGGSIRLPAAFCGVYGIRLSTRAWPLAGHSPDAPPSLKPMNGQGPIVGSLRGMRRVLDALAPELRTGSVAPFSFRGLYIYAPTHRLERAWPGFEDELRPLLEPLGEVRSDHGLPPAHQARNIGLGLYASHLDDMMAMDSFGYRDGFIAVLSSMLFRGRLGDKRFHPRTAENLALLALGRHTVFRNKARARLEAEHLRADIQSLFDRGYLVVAPTVTCSAPRHGTAIRNPNVMSFTLPGNLADVTGLAVPFGQFPDGLPRSIQIWGPPGSENLVIEVAERIPHGFRRGLGDPGRSISSSS